MHKNRFSQIIILFLAVLFMTTGCASFPGKQLPTYATSQISAPEKKISATYDVKLVGIDGAPYTQPIVVKSFDDKVQKVLSSSSIFSDLKSGFEQSDYHYSFVMRNDGIPPLPIAMLNGFVTGFTFGLVPAFARDIYIMTIEVKQGDRVIKTYAYQDHMDSWIHLFLIVLTPFNFPTVVSDKVVDNMMMNFVFDFSNDIRAGVYLAKQN